MRPCSNGKRRGLGLLSCPKGPDPKPGAKGAERDRSWELATLPWPLLMESPGCAIFTQHPDLMSPARPWAGRVSPPTLAPSGRRWAGGRHGSRRAEGLGRLRQPTCLPRTQVGIHEQTPSCTRTSETVPVKQWAALKLKGVNSHLLTGERGKRVRSSFQWLPSVRGLLC